MKGTVMTVWFSPSMTASKRFLQSMSVTGAGYFLVDSGACKNVARSGDFVRPIDRSKAKPLYSVCRGNPLKAYGKQYPHVTVGSREGAIEMTVTDAAESPVSVNAILEKGHEVHCSSKDSA